MFNNSSFRGARVAQWVRSLDLTTHTSLSPIRRGFAPGFVNYKKGALDSQPHVIKFTSCLPMVGGSPRLPPPLKLVVMILLKVALKHKQSINQSIFFQFRKLCKFKWCWSWCSKNSCHVKQINGRCWYGGPVADNLMLEKKMDSLLTDIKNPMPPSLLH